MIFLVEYGVILYKLVCIQDIPETSQIPQIWRFILDEDKYSHSTLDGYTFDCLKRMYIHAEFIFVP